MPDTYGHDEQGVTPVTKIQILSTWSGKGQHRTKSRRSESAKAGQAWGKHAIVDTVQASSMLTFEPISITVLGEPLSCPNCHVVPVWDNEGNLACGCKIWTDPDTAQWKITPEKIDTEIGRERRAQSYQRQLRRFFKGGRC